MGKTRRPKPAPAAATDLLDALLTAAIAKAEPGVVRDWAVALLKGDRFSSADMPPPKEPRPMPTDDKPENPDAAAVRAELAELEKWFTSRPSGQAGNPRGWDDRVLLRDQLMTRLKLLEG